MKGQKHVTISISPKVATIGTADMRISVSIV
jgi:hypothetical protein